MKTVAKIGITLAVAGAVVWSVPPARRYVQATYVRFTSYFHEAEQVITRQLMADDQPKTEPYTP